MCGGLLLGACGTDDGDNDNTVDDARDGGPSSAALDGGGGGALSDSGKPGAAADGGAQGDAGGLEAGPAPRPTGPGAAPTRTPSVKPNGNGFFEVKTAANNLAYWVRLPVGYVASTPWPLVVGLHGCGDNALHFAEWAVSPYTARASQAYIAVSVGGRDGGCWKAAEDEAKVLDVVADVRTLFYVHQKKVTVAGYSSGGALAYYTGLRNAYTFAGILIENSGMPFAAETANVLGAAEWKLNLAITVHTQDSSFPPAVTHANRDALLGAGFPVQFREVAGTHDGSSDEWVDYLLPKIDGFLAP